MARLEESYETNNISVVPYFLCTPQLDLDDDDSCDRFHNTTTYDSSVLALISDVNVDNDPHSTPATLPLIKSGTKYISDLMIDDETTAFCETLHSPVDAPNAYRKCYFEMGLQWVIPDSSVRPRDVCVPRSSSLASPIQSGRQQ